MHNTSSHSTFFWWASVELKSKCRVEYTYSDYSGIRMILHQIPTVALNMGVPKGRRQRGYSSPEFYNCVLGVFFVLVFLGVWYPYWCLWSQPLENNGSHLGNEVWRRRDEQILMRVLFQRDFRWWILWRNSCHFRSSRENSSPKASFVGHQGTNVVTKYSDWNMYRKVHHLNTGIILIQ